MKFNVSDRVFIDGDASLIAIVTAVELRAMGAVRYELSWVASADIKHVYVDEFRITRMEE